MAGQAVSPAVKLRSALAIYRAHKSRHFSDARGDIAHHDDLLGIMSRHGIQEVKGTRILDIGCGQRATQVLLFAADGAQATGIDMEVPTYHMTPSIVWRVLRTNGPERLLKSAVRHILFDGPYARDLQACYREPLSFGGLDVRLMNADQMAFPDNSFDFISSTWVFEHVSDPPAVLKEVNRVLRPGGVAAIRPHLFPSLSGGHDLSWQNPDIAPSAIVEPWDHLRSRRHPPNVYLNGYTIRQYREVFGSIMRILEESPAPPEGASLLTTAIEAELSRAGYSRADALTPHALFVLAKR